MGRECCLPAPAACCWVQTQRGGSMVARTLPQHPWPCTWLPHISSTRTRLWCWQSPCFWAGCGFSPCSMKWFPKTGVVFPKTVAAGDTVMSSPWWPGTPLHLRPWCTEGEDLQRGESQAWGLCSSARANSPLGVAGGSGHTAAFVLWSS